MYYFHLLFILNKVEIYGSYFWQCNGTTPNVIEIWQGKEPLSDIKVFTEPSRTTLIRLSPCK